jgi:hypothetical protein
VNRSWIVLALLVLAGVLALTVLSHSPRRAEAPAPAPPPAPIDFASLEVAGDTLSSPRVDGVLGHRLAVTITNRGSRPATVALSGYEHAFAPRTLAPGGSRTDTLLLDLPGEDFAWMLDGRPAGQLRVAGSHLAEGHR